MAEEKWDAIIVGAGVAGTTAALVLARAGARALVIERGQKAGSKNVSGGRVYTHGLARLFPNFPKDAALERRVAHEKISFLTGDRMATVDFRSAKPATATDSYTVLRAVFDDWLAREAENAGAEVLTGARVDDVVVRGGKAVGVSVAGETLHCDVVILADGVNSLLSERLGMTQRLAAKNTALGVKTVIELPELLIDERFQLSHREGCAWLFAGEVTDGLIGGGFLYTNKTSISLGVVCHLDQIHETGKTAPDMLNTFCRHPLLAPFIADGRFGEYSAHLVSEAGLRGVSPKLADNGVLIVGDAAGLCLNLGFTVRGMDLAIASGEMAAQAVLAAKERKDFSKNSLSYYRALLNNSFVIKDMQTYENTPKVLKTPRFFNAYPTLATDILEDLFTVNGRPAEPLMRKGRRRLEGVGMMSIVKDFIRAMRAL